MLTIIKNFLEGLIPSIEELASFMDPDNTVCIFEPIREVDVHTLEKRYFNEVLAGNMS